MFTTFSRDIGLRKLRETRLAESEERFRRTFEQAAVGIAQLGLDGRLLWCNEKLSAILRATREDLTQRCCADLIAPEDARTVAGLELLLSGEVASHEAEVRLRRDDGTLVWAQLSLSLARDERGRALSYVLVAADATDRRRAHQLEHRLAQILEATPDFVGTMTVDRQPVFLNAAGRAMIGVPVGDPSEPDDVLVHHPEWARRLLLEEALPAVLAGQTWSGETAFLTRTGEEVPTLQVLFAHGGTEPGEQLITTIAHDISEMKRAQVAIEEARHEAERANGAKSQVLANLSHELRTPLTSVIGFSEMLADGHYGEVSARQRECLGNIVEAGHHLLDLINDVLDLAKVEAGRLTLLMDELDAGTLVADLVATIRVLAERKELAVELEIASGLPAVHADARRVKQIVINLLSNAVKFTPEGGWIAVAVLPGDGGDGVRIEVRDSGIGIAPEDQGCLFEPFRQLDASYRRSQQGTGLGLALTRKLAELHGGRVWLESAGVGQGSTFHVALPRWGEAGSNHGDPG
jgi:PAS domain S-box-containing protein